MRSAAKRYRPRRAVVLGFAMLVTVSMVGCVDSPTEPADRLESEAPAPAAANSPPFVGCDGGLQPSGALYQVCFPPEWDGDLVVWAHGYQNPVGSPTELPADEIGGQPIAAIVTGLGYAYATTSYRRKGLVAVDAVADLEELLGIVSGLAGEELEYSYLVGASEGGLSTVLAIEDANTGFDGGMPNCGPVGNFRKQINYFGDFRVVFDYFFPGVMPGNAVAIDVPVTQDNWDLVYKPAIEVAIAAYPHRTEQLLRVTRAPVDPGDPASVPESVTGLLRYSFFATNDAREQLGGNPYGNRFRWYTGSDNDWRLNRTVDRFSADWTALQALRGYETTGDLQVPTVALHTTADPIVPYWHEGLYKLKTWKAGTRLKLNSFPVFRHGHCEFELPEVLAGFALLVYRVSGENLLAAADVFADVNQEREFLEISRELGANPSIVRRP